MKYVIPAAIAIGVGLVLLASFVIPLPELQVLRLTMTNWAVILGGLAVIVGVLNLLLVHARRIEHADRGWPYSLFTILALLGTLLIGVVEGFGADTPAMYRAGSVTNVLFQGVLVASQAALASLIMVFLVVAAARMLKSRPNTWSIVFLIVVIIVLIGWLPLGPILQLQLGRVRQWIIDVPASAGARGILLGVALGTLMIGLRVLTGVERPYKD
jgi:hypothetical protein